MGFRFYKGLRLLPGVRVNFSKRGASLSLGGRGLSVNLSPSGVRTTVGVPGSGVSYRSPTYPWAKPAGAKAAPTLPAGMRLERLRSLQGDPSRYPQSDDECRRLMSEQPKYWEFFLICRLLELRFTALKADWENVTWGREQPGYPRGARDIFKWFEKQTSELRQLSERLGALFQEAQINRAFGPPGVAADPGELGPWVDRLCAELATCVDAEREIQTLRWYPEGRDLCTAMTGWTLPIIKPFFEKLTSLVQQLERIDETKSFDFTIKLDEFHGEAAIAALKRIPSRVWVPYPREEGIQTDSGGPGDGEPPRLEFGGGGGGGDGEKGPKVFFDDGQVRVTEHLVTIGPPWNKAFAVSE
ncbi:MAG: DUF4236 domain-containing protein, partial [Betaproteobacteria bacterium]|nr:DUF4236 domain-containing protein [Betaproteobacteria bacterium]